MTRAQKLLAAASALSLLVAADAGAQQRKVPKPNTVKALLRVVPIALDTLAAGEFPPMIEASNDPSKPLVVPPGAVAPDDLEVVSIDPGVPLATLRKRPGAVGQVQIKLKNPGAGAFMQIYAGQNGYAPGQAYPVTYSCGPAYNNYPPTAVRWERFRVDDDGVATYDVADGFLVMGDCSLKVARKSTFHPQTVLTVGGAPIAFALKGETQLTVFFPREAQVAADTSTQDPEVSQGAMWRVALPLRKGVSASVVADLPAMSVARYLAEARGKPVTVEPEANTELSIGVDAVQTVSDGAPTVVLNVRSR